MIAARTVALDSGSHRVGVAVSDPLGITAQPVGVLTVGPRFLDDLQRLLEQWTVERIVVGLPVGLDGREGAAAEAARRLAAEVAAATGIDTVLYDERFSTVVAERAMIAGGARRERRRQRRDAVAAAVFLQDYLDGRRA